VSVRVLLVDDEEVPRRLLAAELSSAGFDVSEAADGLEGLGLFEELDPDVVVTDKNMPRANGLELLSAIREYELSIKRTHLDTSSVSVHGEYPGSTAPIDPDDCPSSASTSRCAPWGTATAG